MISRAGFTQILFLEECFTGGVQTGGHSTIGALIGGTFDIDWEDNYTLRKAYAITYRYGRPEPYTIYINGGAVEWNSSNQAGPELLEENFFSNYFAAHAVEITNQITITGDVVNIDFPVQTFYDFAWNWGWWGAYIAIMYESPDITSEVCTRIYIADQSQDFPQNYVFAKPDYLNETPVLFSIYSHRLSEFENDKTRVRINNETIGELWGGDLVTPVPGSGVQGHFYYQNSIAEGLNGDTANLTVHRQDGIAVINEYLSGSASQTLDLIPLSFPNTLFFANPHPAFLLTYTPSCSVPTASMPRTLTYCRGETAELSAIPGYDHYAWSSSENLSDSTIANPLCTADTSRWYTVRMWDDGGNVCPQTIPVFVEVGDIPRPSPLAVNNSGCPNNSGRIRFQNTPGKAPLIYSVGDITQPGSDFNNLPPGTYPVSVTDALGCSWDSMATIGLNTVQTAAFTPNPTSGDSPLTVYFANQSTNATGYQWLVDGEPFSTGFNAIYTFADSGYFEVSLVAWVGVPSCADTATYLIRVDPGIKVAMPNIITPNGDGLNDRLVAQLFGVSRISWIIYNRWGQEISTGEDSSGASELEIWDAQSGGNQVSDGVYQITTVVQGLSGKVERMQFQVTVVR